MLITLSLILCTTVSFAEENSVKIPKDVVEKALADKDPTVLLRDYMFPMLAEDIQSTLLFAAEINISNGRPYFDFGERSLFGKLVDASGVMKHMDEYADLADDCYQEMYRLFFGVYEKDGHIAYGKWEKHGKTVFSFAARSNRRVLSYETGTWTKQREVYGILVEHWTELSGMHKSAFIELDWKHLGEDGFYNATFKIVRR